MNQSKSEPNFNNTNQIIFESNDNEVILEDEKQLNNTLPNNMSSNMKQYYEICYSIADHEKDLELRDVIGYYIDITKITKTIILGQDYKKNIYTEVYKHALSTNKLQIVKLMRNREIPLPIIEKLIKSIKSMNMDDVLTCVIRIQKHPELAGVKSFDDFKLEPYDILAIADLWAINLDELTNGAKSIRMQISTIIALYMPVFDPIHDKQMDKLTTCETEQLGDCILNILKDRLFAVPHLNITDDVMSIIVREYEQHFKSFIYFQISLLNA
jgi:hypothetical protein